MQCDSIRLQTQVAIILSLSVSLSVSLSQFDMRSIQWRGNEMYLLVNINMAAIRSQIRFSSLFMLHGQNPHRHKHSLELTFWKRIQKCRQINRPMEVFSYGNRGSAPITKFACSMLSNSKCKTMAKHTLHTNIRVLLDTCTLWHTEYLGKTENWFTILDSMRDSRFHHSSCLLQTHKHTLMAAKIQSR